MIEITRIIAGAVAVAASVAMPPAAHADGDDGDDGDDHGGAGRCRDVRADLVEDFATEGCKPGEPNCFLGEVDGRGLRGTTHFRGDSSATGPSTSPGWRSYSGLFEYTTHRGTLLMRETGVINTTPGTPHTGAVTAYQMIISGTGAYADATGYLFVSGFSLAGHVETKVTGTICRR